MIQILEAAEVKDSNPADYDGGLWSQRVATLQHNGQRVAEHNLARFDLALTVSIARYIRLASGEGEPRTVCELPRDGAYFRRSAQTRRPTAQRLCFAVPD